MTNRRAFFKQLAGIGLFSILPGAGRIWKAETVIQPALIVDPFEVFRAPMESLPEEIDIRVFSASIWMSLVPRGQFPKGAGETVRPIADA